MNTQASANRRTDAVSAAAKATLLRMRPTLRLSASPPLGLQRCGRLSGLRYSHWRKGTFSPSTFNALRKFSHLSCIVLALHGACY